MQEYKIKSKNLKGNNDGKEEKSADKFAENYKNEID